MTFFGAVGDDADGRELLATLRAAGVGVSDVGVRSAENTGTAVALVDAAGDNVIIVAAGANGSVDLAYLEATWPLIQLVIRQSCGCHLHGNLGSAEPAPP